MDTHYHIATTCNKVVIPTLITVKGEYLDFEFAQVFNRICMLTGLTVVTRTDKLVVLSDKSIVWYYPCNEDHSLKGEITNESDFSI